MRAELGKDPSRAPPSQLNLPPGFRFYPTDEELVVHYLCKRSASEPFSVPIIAEVELYKFDPWDLPERALFGEREWYFFSPRDRKYPNGSRPNRAAGAGYWKATGTDKPICTNMGTKKVGVKKALVFYKGKAPKGVKTNWIMHEYRLADSATRSAKRKGTLRLDDWVLCRIYKKCSGASNNNNMAQKTAKESRCESSSFDDAVIDSLPDAEEEDTSEAHEAFDDKRGILDSIGGSGRDFAWKTTEATTTQSFGKAQGAMVPPPLPTTSYNQYYYNHHGSFNSSTQQQTPSSLDLSHPVSNELSHSALESSSAQEDDSVVESAFNTFPTFNTNTNTTLPSSGFYGYDLGLPSPTSSMLGGSGLTDTDAYFQSFSQLLDSRNSLLMWDSRV